MIACEWLTGAWPLHPRGATFKEIVRDISTRAPAPIAHFRPDLTDEFQRFIMRMLEKKPRRRPAGMLSTEFRFLAPNREEKTENA